MGLAHFQISSKYQEDDEQKEMADTMGREIMKLVETILSQRVVMDIGDDSPRRDEKK